MKDSTDDSQKCNMTLMITTLLSLGTQFMILVGGYDKVSVQLGYKQKLWCIHDWLVVKVVHTYFNLNAQPKI